MAQRSQPSDMRLKVGLVIDDSLDHPDGVQQYVLTVGAWLQSQGHTIHYLTSTTTRQDIPHIHSLARKVAVRFNGNHLRIPLPASRRAIRQLLEQEQFDVLHVQMPYSPLLAGRIVAAAPPRTAVIGTFHIVPKSWLVALGSQLLAVWCRKTLRRFDAVCSVSSAAQTFAARAFGIRSDIIPNAVALAGFREARPFPPTAREAAQLLFLGRLVPRKGCRVLLEALRLLKDDAAPPAFYLTVCGGGVLMTELKQFVRAWGLDQYVRFTGFVSESDKRRYYAGADITVFPSNGGESFGIVLVEAAANGRSAVLAGDNSGYRTVLEDCPDDVLFDPHDPRALADLLRDLLRDGPKRRRIAAWQHRHAEQFDVGHVGAQLLGRYDAALRHRRDLR